jgi:hypothetical protein
MMKNNKFLFYTLTASTILLLNLGSSMAKPPLEIVNDTDDHITVTINTRGGPGRETKTPKHIGFDRFSARRNSFEPHTLTHTLAPNESWEITKTVVVPTELNLVEYASYPVEFSIMTVKKAVKEGEEESLLNSNLKEHLHFYHEYFLDDGEEESQPTLKYKKYSIQYKYYLLKGIYIVK